MPYAMYGTRSLWEQSVEPWPTYPLDPTWPDSGQSGASFGGSYPEPSGYDAQYLLSVSPDFYDP